MFTWVAQHRRHHLFADSAGDPHSPWRYGPGLGPQLRGLWHAHVGWFFVANPSDPEPWIPDLLADGDLQLISRTATLWAWLSILLPLPSGLAAHRHHQRRPVGLAVGQRRAHPAAASRDLGGELGRSHVRQAAVPHPGPQHQLYAVGAAQLRRLLAQRPSRLPAPWLATASSPVRSTPPLCSSVSWSGSGAPRRPTGQPPPTPPDAEGCLPAQTARGWKPRIKPSSPQRRSRPARRAKRNSRPAPQRDHSTASKVLLERSDGILGAHIVARWLRVPHQPLSIPDTEFCVGRPAVDGEFSRG